MLAFTPVTFQEEIIFLEQRAINPQRKQYSRAVEFRRYPDILRFPLLTW